MRWHEKRMPARKFHAVKKSTDCTVPRTLGPDETYLFLARGETDRPRLVTPPWHDSRVIYHVRHIYKTVCPSSPSSSVMFDDDRRTTWRQQTTTHCNTDTRTDTLNFEVLRLESQGYVFWPYDLILRQIWLYLSARVLLHIYIRYLHLWFGKFRPLERSECQIWVNTTTCVRWQHMNLRPDDSNSMAI